MIDKIKRMSRTLIHKGVIFDYYQEKMIVQNGNTVIYDMIEHKGAAACLGVLPDGRIPMVRQYRPALDRFTLEIPAGGLNDGESIDTCRAALRELEEETGYGARSARLLLSINTTVAFCNEKIDIYLADDLFISKQHLDENEFVEVELCTLEQLLGMISNSEITDSKTICALQAYSIMRE